MSVQHEIDHYDQLAANARRMRDNMAARGRDTLVPKLAAKYHEYSHEAFVRRLFHFHKPVSVNGYHIAVVTDEPLRESEQPWRVVSRVFVGRPTGPCEVVRRP